MVILFIPRAVETTIVFIITMASSSNILNYKPTCTSKFSFINHAFISNFLGTFQESPAILRLIFFGCSCHKQIEYHLFHINIFGGNKKTSGYLDKINSSYQNIFSPCIQYIKRLLSLLLWSKSFYLKQKIHLLKRIFHILLLIQMLSSNKILYNSFYSYNFHYLFLEHNVFGGCN